MKIDVLEGIDYAGKSTVASIIVPRFDYNHYSLSNEQKKTLCGLNPEERVDAFFRMNMDMYSRILQENSNGANVLIERFWTSTIPYHNVQMKRHIEKDERVAELINSMVPDKIILVTATLDAVKRRMEIRPPVSNHEKDPYLLMEIQKEYLRFISYVNKKMNIPFVHIDNSSEDISELEKSLDVLQNF